MAELSLTAVFKYTKMPLSHIYYFLLLLPVLFLPHVVSTSNTTSLTHHRYHPSTNAGLTHRSIYSPSVAAHRSRYLGARDTSALPRSALANQQTRLETSRHFDHRNDYRHSTASTSLSPTVPSRSYPKFYSATTTNTRHPVILPPPASDHTAVSDRSPYRVDQLSPADLIDSPLMGVLSPNPESFEDPVFSAPDASSKGASMSKLDAMLSRLESTNDEMLEELQHERDQVAARRREHHQERINRHQSRRRRPPRRHDNDPQPRRQTNQNDHNNNERPFNLAGTGDVVPRHHNHRLNNQFNNVAMTPDTATLRGSPSGRGGEGITRVEVPRITGGEVPRITGGEMPGNHHTRSSINIDNMNTKYYSPRSQGSRSDLPSEAGLQDLGTLGEEEATFLEEADYQDEQAAKGRGSGVHQHHLRERDAQSLRLASENVRYVMTNARCASPVRRCIDLSVNQTVIGKKYWPRCAIVSRCGEESGCCYSPDHVCTVAESHLIDLYFFYVTFEANSRAGVDRLTFENHTKCECRPRPPPLPSTFTATLPNDQPTPNNWPSYSSPQQNSLSYDRQTKDLQQPLGDQSEDVRGNQHGIENTFHAEPLRRQPDVASDEDASYNEINRNGPLRQTPPPSELERLHVVAHPEPERHHVVAPSVAEHHHVVTPSEPERRHVVAHPEPERHHVVAPSVAEHHHVVTPPEPERRHVVAQSQPERHHVTGRGRDKPRDDGNTVKSLDLEATTDNSMELKTIWSTAHETTTTAAAVITSGLCTCPDVYFPSLSPTVPGACECVCDSTTGNCRRLMKGKRYFKEKDENCILSGECGVPTCKFGPFLMNYKRCPRKREAKKGKSRS